MFDSLFFVATIQLTFLVDKLGRTLKGFFLVKYSASLPLSEAISVDASSVSSSVSPLTSRSSLVIASTKVCLLEDGTSPYTTLVACVESTPVEVVAITACRVEVEAPSLMDIVVTAISNVPSRSNCNVGAHERPFKKNSMVVRSR